MVTDQTVYEQLETVFERAEKDLGGLDIIVNCAGISAGKITDDEYREWRYAIEVNLVGLMACCRLAMDRMVPKKKGHIVNIGSMSADAEEESSVYVASKSGVRGFTKALAQEANKEGIRATLIEPGWVDTDMAKEEEEDTESKVKEDKMLRAIDIAECVHYVLTQPERCNVEFIQIRPRVEEE
jgi:NADP-dependent 3-hydroxy acid dehydrogenase YdfG